LLEVVVKNCGDELVLGLEVVVDVADRHVGALGNLGQRRPVHALLVEERGRAPDEALSFAGASRH
jgi:hypothetical protein